jgi:hypothetical protein
VATERFQKVDSIPLDVIVADGIGFGGLVELGFVVFALDSAIVNFNTAKEEGQVINQQVVSGPVVKGSGF